MWNRLGVFAEGLADRAKLRSEVLYLYQPDQQILKHQRKIIDFITNLSRLLFILCLFGAYVLFLSTINACILANY